MIDINAARRITQYLMLGDFDNVQRYCDSQKTPENLRAWALAKMHKRLTKAQASLLNEAVLAQYDGWEAYNIGDYDKSHYSFVTAQNVNTEDSYGVGLGLAKVYTRLGHWEIAKQWLLHELPMARQQNDLYGQAQCYGALGEVFLRANYPKLAYECFGNAFHVLPKGSSQREKQYNFQASALIRTGNTEQAEQCLMSALYLADGKQIDSVWHSLARLQFLWLQQEKNDAVETYYAEYLQKKPGIPVAEGFLKIASAFLAYRQENKLKAIDLAEEALSCFNDKFPMESYWAKKILQALKNEPFSTQPINTVKTTSPESSSNLIEAPWLKHTLPDQGFRPIQDAQTLEDLWDARLLFFI
ncbi:MAG: hypothetical protein QX197_01150 [Methylococcaceae bacterium]